MKVQVEVSADYCPPYAVIYTDAVTEEIQRVIDLLGRKEMPVVAQKGDRNVLLKPEEIYMVRVEGGETVLYTEKEVYRSRKRLYEVQEKLGGRFLQISKQTVVNLSYIQSVDAGFSGTLMLRMNNGLDDYVSRKFLPAFKKYLGL